MLNKLTQERHFIYVLSFMNEDLKVAKFEEKEFEEYRRSYKIFMFFVAFTIVFMLINSIHYLGLMFPCIGAALIIFLSLFGTSFASRFESVKRIINNMNDICARYDYKYPCFAKVSASYNYENDISAIIKRMQGIVEQANDFIGKLEKPKQ